MTIIACVRHGKCDPIGKYIAGRMPGIFLNGEGKNEVSLLARYLDNIQIDKIYSSPLERTCETASIICDHKHMHFDIAQDLIEIDYGEWTGRSFNELSEISLWNDYNCNKKLLGIPGGEMLIEIECRMAFFVEKVRKETAGVIMLVSHADPIKCLIAHYAGMAIDAIDKFEISPASISIITVDDYGAQINCVNYTEYKINGRVPGLS
jgi:broad specificity phosphatase PhoE